MKNWVPSLVDRLADESKPRRKKKKPYPSSRKKASAKKKTGSSKSQSSSRKRTNRGQKEDRRRGGAGGRRQGKREELVGQLRFHPQGFGWFYPDPSDEKNQETAFDFENEDRLKVPGRDLGVALDGDLVQVEARQQRAFGSWKNRRGNQGSREEKEWVGEVTKVLKRRSGIFVGVLEKRGKRWLVTPDDRSLPSVVTLPNGAANAQDGQKVAVKLTAWKSRETIPQGEVVEVLGSQDDPKVEIRSVIAKYGLRQDFPQEVKQEALAISEKIPAEELAQREDWRKEIVLTIDPSDAKDHDDAVWVRRCSEAEGGGWDLAVHIADVSHYVKPGSPLDREARLRGNSTYLVDRVIPMLPEELSNGICSLKPNQDRLTKCVWMRFNAKGKLMDSKLQAAVICSPAKLSYEQAQEMLTGQVEDGETSKAVLRAWELAKVLRENRFQKGALDLDMPEVRVKLDERGEVTGVAVEPYNESHQLIEEFMVIANEVVGRILKQRQKPAIYRVHEDPDPERLMDFTEVARQYGYEPGDLTNRKHVQTLLASIKGKPEEQAVKVGFLKSLQRAVYSEEPLGHYGLAKIDYCHFTSPIRRYADLVVHRSMQSLLINPPRKPDRIISQNEAKETARHISITERFSADAENETRRRKMLEYLASKIGGADAPLFEGMVTDVRRMGIFVEVFSLGTRGLVKREDLPGGEWQPDLTRMRFTRSHDGGTIKMGQRVNIAVNKVDFENLRVDFRVVEK